jgi:hypothetical protein
MKKMQQSVLCITPFGVIFFLYHNDYVT